METATIGSGRLRRAFTMIELLTVIAIIAILAAILFPVFAAVREQSRQANTISNLHNMYTGSRLFYEDEGHFPSSLFGYGVTAVSPVPTDGSPLYRPALPTDSNESIIAMNEARENFKSAGSQTVNNGYLYGEQVKDYISFLCTDNLQTNKNAVTQVYYPIHSPISLAQSPVPSLSQANGQSTLQNGVLVTWQGNSGCLTPDPDIPDSTYAGQPKLYYVMDSMDIGPMLDDYGAAVKDGAGHVVYELHYTPDWTHKSGLVTPDNGCSDLGADGKPILTQLKYKNPPSDKTVITYVTHHAATTGSSNVLTLLLSGSVPKVQVKAAYDQLPTNYK